MEITESDVKGLVHGFKFPPLRSVCICGSFEPGEEDGGMSYIRCKNCRGWKSWQDIVNDG